ncbi:unnamed protein product [Darwinula stevensoni]|uniref:alpha-mannosidase n=1 Tax=Darwinula stevensoni TaxID=69355 RepID=A0A7R8XDZ7_9CRUS|nr:unnamed protein product [Darwinula stevensoni]CAG0889167.1 unnamed protein product [Darwinula stevensoni]
MERRLVAPLRKNPRTTLERIEKAITKNLFKDTNLYGRLYLKTKPVTELYHWSPEERKQSWLKIPKPWTWDCPWTPVEIGHSFGPTWSTHWFKVDHGCPTVVVEIPEEWKGEEVHLCWDSGSEALLFSSEGFPLQGLSSQHRDRRHYVMSKNHDPSAGYRREYYIEMACNGDFGAGAFQIGPPDEEKTYQLRTVELRVFDNVAFGLMMDLEVMHDVGRFCSPDDPFTTTAVYTGNHILNLLAAGKQFSRGALAGFCRDAVAFGKEFFAQESSGSGHTAIGIGNCHIDSAWLWPVRETIRKCARSWSTSIRLMEEFPHYVFACSQAQQLEWVQDYYPSLFEEIRKFAAEGRFVPVGGAWVEMDGNIPSGEAFIRHFLLGQRFFLKEFGFKCQEFWLPDTFGYSAQIPQILKHVGLEYFLTQKMSWNLVNKFPHNHFVWEGLDGSTVLAHFPPSNTYVDEVKVENLVTLMKELKDKGRTRQSVMLYGYGDGGGGPTRTMLERAQRLRHLPGLPRVQLGVPKVFWEGLKEEEANLCRWVGELYLELHNGTYTTQLRKEAELKRLNRRCERSLQDVEFLLTLLIAKKMIDDDTLARLKSELVGGWKKVLLNQFHDILPGSSIEMVNVEARQTFQEVLNLTGNLQRHALQILGKRGPSGVGDTSASTLFVNPLSWQVEKVCRIGGYLPEVKGDIQKIPASEEAFVFVSLDPLSVQSVNKFLSPSAPVTIGKVGGYFSLENSNLRAKIDQYGRLISLCVKKASPEDEDNGDGDADSEWREAVPRGQYANQLCLFQDIPLFWDAWDVMDYHLETRTPLNGGFGAEMGTPKEVEGMSGPLVVAVEWSMKVGDKSQLLQRISLSADSPYLEMDTTVHWFESHKMLKVEFPMNVLCREATYDIQFGHLRRPTHANTSWDAAKFEVCGHKWGEMGEHGFGVGVLNDGKYGWNATGNILSLSLLRSPKSPDANADMGTHNFRYAIFPHHGTFQEAGIIQRSYEFNMDWTSSQISGSLSHTLGEVSHPGVILETAKPAEDGNKSYVLRLYEAFGARVQNVRVKLVGDVKSVALCSGLEEKKRELILLPNNSIQLSFTPFQIHSLFVTVD